MGLAPSKVELEGPTVKKSTKKKSTANVSLTEDESTTAADETPKGLQKRRTNNAETPIRKNGQKNFSSTKLNADGLADLPEQSPARPAPISTHITDDEIHVNLAMADLMAYLQVIATNSQNLPMTRRDDPERGNTVSALSADDYARKSAAFIPADVRVIAGSFSKYGRVWDLPTSEEYDASDGAQEPGRSYGGACCNSMLKVLYDAANEAADSAQQAAVSDSIFDDEDDESLFTNTVELERGRTFASLVLGVVPTTITWAALLRKMKAEINEIEYAQAPVITSTRKFDLNKPFSLVSDGFDRNKNTMRSLLIGCNYTNIPGAELKAGHDDVRSMKDYIVNVHGFPETKSLMTVLMDDDKHNHPTHANIVQSLKALAEQSQPGDVVFIQFSGHGGRVLDSLVDTEAEGYDEAFAPSDYLVSGLVRDTLIYKVLLAPMRYGVSVTMIVDTCDTGMMLDLPYAWSTKKERRETTARLTPNDDFSFIRFLKVVKTLYEASTFTQLGNTVGSALKPPKRALEDEESDDSVVYTTTALDRTAPQSGPPPQQSAIVRALASCTSPHDCDMEQVNNKLKSDNTKPAEVKASEETSKSQGSLLDQVMACTLGTADGDFSDDDTYGPSVLDDETLGTDTLGENTTYDSFTDADDGYESPRRRQNRSRRQ